MSTTQDSGTIQGVFFLISDEHSRHFYMGVPPPPPFLHLVQDRQCHGRRSEIISMVWLLLENY